MLKGYIAVAWFCCFFCMFFWLTFILYRLIGFLFSKHSAKVLSVQVFGCKKTRLYTWWYFCWFVFEPSGLQPFWKKSDSERPGNMNPENSIASLPAAMHPTKQDKGGKTTLLSTMWNIHRTVTPNPWYVCFLDVFFFQRVLRTEVGGKVAMQLPASVFGVGETSPVVTRRIDEESYNNTLIFFHNSKSTYVDLLEIFREHNLRNFQDVLYIYDMCFPYFLPWSALPKFFGSIHPAAGVQTIKRCATFGVLLELRLLWNSWRIHFKGALLASMNNYRFIVIYIYIFIVRI